MPKSNKIQTAGPHSPGRRLLSSVFACLATLLAAAPVQAVEIPRNPLQSGFAYPPPNILFVMDDSGSMAWRYMYNPGITSISGGNISSGRTGNNTSTDSAYDTTYNINALYDQNYITNTVYYNPNMDYQAWFGSNGEPLTGGTNYGSAYSSNVYVTEPAAGTTSGTTNLLDSNQTFYVPKPDATNFSDATQYYRYQIRTDGRVVRSERLQGNGRNNGVAGAGCATTTTGWGWRNCVYATPTGRSEDAEKTNFATWFSYHRTRAKAAKAGASVAFSKLGNDVRVGFRTIWGRNGSATTGNNPTQDVPIPVGHNSGLFDNPEGVLGANNNRQKWYSRLFASEASNGTPLRSALDNAGLYFSEDSSSGPYGPESGSNQFECRQNFTILTTDGFWNSDSGFSSDGNQDGTDGTTITRPGGSSYTYVASAPYRDNRSNTLADVAMRYWKNDLRPDLANIVPNSGANPAFWQHMVTFGISIGLRGSTGFTSVADVPSNYAAWPDPLNAEDADRIDDLLHAAVNSRGSFVSASNPDEFSKALTDAFEVIAARRGSGSNVAANSTSFRADTRVYQARYWSGRWTGDLLAYPASSAGVADTPAWNASQHIPAPDQRNIRTRVNPTTGNGTTFPTAAQTAALDQSTRTHAPATAEENAAYIAGATNLEIRNTGNLRNREIVVQEGGADVVKPTVLGDIINSSPIYVRDNETIFVGANDGMLHAFNAANGVERFAYVPRGINLAELATLSDPQYTHKYFVDGPIVVSTRVQTPGKNYLVGALGRGGKGVFGLDVTNPASFGNNQVLWDQTGDALGNNMGMVLGEPLVVTLNGPSANKVKAVVVSNGVNSNSGIATLFIINLATGAVIREISTGVGGDNGLFAPRGRDVNGDGTVDYVYAGDLKGNLWKFDLSGEAGASWDVDYGGEPMFTTKTGQPITGGLALARDPVSGRRWVFFGTGRFMTESDIRDNTVQSLYGIIDEGSDRVELGDLVEREIAATGTSADGKPIRGFQANTPLPADKMGWYVDLDDPSPGERVVTRPLLDGNVLVVSSLIPPTDNPCEAGGSGYVNALDAFTGTSLDESYFSIDDDEDDPLVDADGNPVPVGSVDLGVGMPTLPTVIEDLLVVGGSTGELGSTPINPTIGPAQRVSWREILGD